MSGILLHQNCMTDSQSVDLSIVSSGCLGARPGYIHWSIIDMSKHLSSGCTPMNKENKVVRLKSLRQSSLADNGYTDLHLYS